jgi:hypothetical protein
MPPAARGKLFEKSFPLDPLQKLSKGWEVKGEEGDQRTEVPRGPSGVKTNKFDAYFA